MKTNFRDSLAPLREFIKNNLTALKRSLLFKEFLLFSVASVCFHGSRFVASLFAAKLLGPTSFGLWNLLSLIITYSGIIHFGVINAMNRDIPLFRGKGDFSKVEEIRSTSFGFMCISSLLAVVVIIIISLFFSDSELRICLVLLAGLLFFNQMYSYCQIYLISDIRFDLMSYQQFFFAIILCLLTIPLTVIFSLPGFIAAQMITIIFVLLFIFHLIPILSIKFKLNLPEIRRLIRVGFPIMSVGLLQGLLTTADRWIVASFLGVEQLGFYSLTIMVTGLLSLVPIVVGQQIYPRMAETFGSTSDFSSLNKWINRQLLMTFSVTLPILIGVFLLFPPFVHKFLPEYIPGIPAMKIALGGIVFLSITGCFGNFLNTVDKQIYYLAAQFITLSLNVAINITLVKLDFGLIGISIGNMLTYAIYAIFLIWLYFIVLKQGSRSNSNPQIS